jgi:DNA-binding transcriptional LysR family regulator
MKTKTTLDQWYVLQSVIDCEGYAQAAEKLHRSQSSISYSISKLQQQLGLKLLQVKGRKAQLTEAGAVMLRRSRELLDDASRLEQLALTMGQGWEAEINLVVDAAFPTKILMQALKKFSLVSQGTRVQLDEVVLSGAEDALLEGRADIAVSAQVPANYLGNALMKTQFIAVAHPDHPLHHIDHLLTSDDLLKEMQIVIRDSSIQHRRDWGWLGAENRWTVSSIETSITTICEGLGFGWLPAHKIQRQLESKQLQPLNLQYGKTYYAYLYLILGNTEKTGPATTKLVEIINKLCNG